MRKFFKGLSVAAFTASVPTVITAIITAVAPAITKTSHPNCT